MAYGFSFTFRHDDNVIDVKIFERNGIKKAVFKDCETKKVLLTTPHIDKILTLTKRLADVRDDLKAHYIKCVDVEPATKIYRVVATLTMEYTHEISAQSFEEAKQNCEKMIESGLFDKEKWLIEQTTVNIESIEELSLDGHVTKE